MSRATHHSQSRSIFGVIWSHALGDADSLSRFLRLISSFYVDPAGTPHRIPLTLPIGTLPMPTAEQIAKHRSITMTPTPPPTLAERDSSALGEYDLLCITPTRAHVMGMKRILRASLDVSTQDCLSAWWASVLERIGEPLSIMTYVINARALLGCPDAASNAVPVLDIPIPSSPEHRLSAVSPSHEILDRTRTIALVIRTAILQLRDPTFRDAWFSVSAHDMYTLADRQWIVQDLRDGDHVGIVNSHIKIKWTNASFGFDQKHVAFQYAFKSAGTLHAAPTNGADGYEISFRVRRGKQELVEAMMRVDLDRWLKTDTRE